MDLFKDDSGYAYYCVSEVDFGDVTVEWWNYRCNMPAIKNAGGMYATAIYDSKTGKFLSKRHYRSDYMRMHCTPRFIEEIKNMLAREKVKNEMLEIH